MKSQPQMFFIRGVGQQDQPGHARLEDDPIGRVELDDHALAEPPHPVIVRPTTRRRQCR